MWSSCRSQCGYWNLCISTDTSGVRVEVRKTSRLSVAVKEASGVGVEVIVLTGVRMLVTVTSVVCIEAIVAME